MRRSSLVDSYIGHGEEREREIERERSRNVEEIAQGLSLERRTESSRNGGKALSSILRGRGHFRGTNARLFSTLRSPSFTFGKRERKSCAQRPNAKDNNFLLGNRPTDRWSVQTTRLSGASLISEGRKEESLPARIRWRASKQLNYSPPYRYFHISRLNSL